MVGKRKRDTSVVSRNTTADVKDVAPTATDASYDLLRKYFESQFQPLELPTSRAPRDNTESIENDSKDEQEDSDSGSEWNGVSDGESEDNKVEVVECKDSRVTTDDVLDKKARKAFMNSKPPSLSADSTTLKATSTKAKDEEEDKNTDAEDLKNDLALQRLLRESHLLDSASELAPSGKNRHKALDLRMQTLGAKTSIYTQQNMPSAHRKGINAKAAMKEERRRREARENGIILEKPTFKSKASDKRRERGVGGPSVGKFAGGTLHLSKKDLSAIQGSRRTPKGKAKGRR